MSNRDLRQDVDYTIYRKRRDSRNCRNNGGGLVGGGGGYGNECCGLDDAAVRVGASALSRHAIG